MSSKSYLLPRYSFVICLFVLALITLLIAMPFINGRNVNAARPDQTKTSTSLPNYDIRTDKTKFEAIAEMRGRTAKRASDVADLRDAMVTGETELRSRIPSLKVEYNLDIRIPEVIATETALGRNFLTPSTRKSRVAVLKDFIEQNEGVFGLRGGQVAELKVAADYTNPNGVLSFVELNQEINGVPVFRGEIKAGFTRDGQMIRVINNLAPGIDIGSTSIDFGSAESAVASAARHINMTPAEVTGAVDAERTDELKVTFGTGDSATTAEKMYFPTEPGVVVPAWRVLIWQPVDAYYIIVDAATGEMLWRKNITEEQTQSATYGIYSNPNGMMQVARSPFPIAPGPNSPNGAQGAGIPRTSVSRIGNEGVHSFNNNGWLADGVTVTDGNAIQSGLDRDGTDGVDPNSEAFSASRNFVYEYTPLDPNTNVGQAPVPVPQTYPGSAFQQGSTAHQFFISNWYHDETYRLGFTEQARNFQHNNFGRGGVGNDRIRGEGQDTSGTNNANFSTPADGGRGRMQMYLFVGASVNIDGNLDSDVVVHELTHGLSNRLHGNGSGLTHDMARGMGEGWSDFYALAMMSSPQEPLLGIYTIGNYDLFRSGGTFILNAYYGFRRFPAAIMAHTGGPNNRPHNPLTFADIDSTQINLNDGAFSPRFIGTSDQVHSAGEIWCNTLWEIRAKYITRLGWEVGNRRVLQHITDGMKLAPLSPSFLQERDAIIAAGLAGGTDADVEDMWAGFALRGMGANASVQNVGGTSTGGTGTARVTQSFDLPNLLQTPAITISDATGNNNGFPEPGENISITIPLRNLTGRTATGTTLQVVGGNAVNYGTISSNTTASQTVAYQVPAGTPCGSVLTITMNVNSSLGPVSFTHSFNVGQPVVTMSENFDSVTAPAVPAGWSVTSSYGPMTWVSRINNADTAPNSMFAANLPDCQTGCPTTNGGSTELTSPVTAINAAASVVSFRHKFNTEQGWDGGVLEISISGSAWQDFVTAGGVFLQNGYNGFMGVSTPNPLGGRAGWTGNSGGYITTIGRVPSTAVGQNVQFRWRMGTDSNSAPVGGGWDVDTVTVSGNYSCAAPPTGKARADYDGDGRTDISVFRPTDGNFYLNRSTAGILVASWGSAGDIPTPADFDGDGKTDIAIYRPSSGQWFVINSGNGTVSVSSFGIAEDVPQAGDFDGDGKADIALYRPSEGVWWRLQSSNGQIAAASFGLPGDLPVAADYNGNGRNEIAVYRPNGGLWFVFDLTTGQVIRALSFGIASDKPVQADYDGDGKVDVAVFRPSTGQWFWLNSTTDEPTVASWGLDGDIPVPGDYNGDGRDDLAIYRNGTWFINPITAGVTVASFGVAGDVPIPNKYLPLN